MIYTKRDLTFRTQGGLIVNVPRGALVEDDKLVTHGYYFISPNTFPQWSIEYHDATYYGFRVTLEDCDIVE